MADSKPTERHEQIQFRQLLEEAVSKHFDGRAYDRIHMPNAEGVLS